MKIDLTLREVEALLLNNSESFVYAVFSLPINKNNASKITLKQVLIKKIPSIAFEKHEKTKTITKNYPFKECQEHLKELLSQYKELFLRFTDKEYQLQIAYERCKGKATECVATKSTSHNRIKNYILPEGKPIDFLVALGLMNQEGSVAYSCRDKFKQVNRFLEMIADIVPEFSQDTIRIVDFGCGKAYLTFAMYYYFHNILKKNVFITGIDLKEEVLSDCQKLADQLGYNQLCFQKGSIQEYSGDVTLDLIVALHACDVATDYALQKACLFQAKVLLVAPCCQHEINSQIDPKSFPLMLKHGLLKERYSALLTDAIRATLLEEAGYKVQLLEFIDPTHTPKNLLIRAVFKGKKVISPELHEMLKTYQLKPTLARLLHKAHV
ncbi:MAG TPA: SAM-dependent methyltransferase [Chlamydiales bacterium]|nr:SAM-dependent methyltransferase [Chlamydiales bacterium]